MKKLLLILFTFLSVSGFTQNNIPPKAIKQLKKAVEIFNNGKTDKGLDDAKKVLYQYPQVTELWDIISKMYFQNLIYTRGNFQESLNNSIKEALLKASENDKKEISTSFGHLQPYINAQMGFRSFMREATLKSRSSTASMYLRTNMVDGEKPDSLVSKEAKSAFDKAEEYFANGKYESAIPFYREAIEKAEGKYFLAELYLGDSYYMLHEYDSATKYFHKCALDFPQYIEPHKFLADSYSMLYEYDKALESCIQGIFIYPDVSMFAKLEPVAKYLRKQYDDGWIVRGCYPVVSSAIAVNAQGPWAAYQEFSKKAWAASDSLGVIENPADFENEKYAEVYAWKKMLEQDGGKSPELTFANKMNKEGHLDSYVFISLFHYDLLPTYRHFIANHSEKATTFLKDVVLFKSN